MVQDGQNHDAVALIYIKTNSSQKVYQSHSGGQQMTHLRLLGPFWSPQTAQNISTAHSTIFTSMVSNKYNYIAVAFIDFLIDSFP